MSQSLVKKFAFAFVCIPAALLLGNGVANAGQTVDLAGTIACTADKWNETEPEKGHKLVDGAGRCVDVPNDSAAPMWTENWVGKYEFMPDESWKASGTCTWSFKGDKGGDQISIAWDEGSHLKEFLYKITGGTGKYAGAKGGGTYTIEELPGGLYGGRRKGKMELP